jgi:predicted Rossmann-fold nucleotide-binding protein
VDSSFWNPLLDWIKLTLIQQEQYVSPEDLELFTVVDNANEAVDVILSFYEKYSMKPNF